MPLNPAVQLRPTCNERMQDYRNVEQGVYALPWDMTTSSHRQWSPFWVAQRTAQVCPSCPQCPAYPDLFLAPRVQQCQHASVCSLRAIMPHLLLVRPAFPTNEWSRLSPSPKAGVHGPLAIM